MTDTRMKLIALALATGLVVVTVWLGSAVVRLENYRHANVVGMCSKYNISDPIQRIQREDCLERTQNSNPLVLAPSLRFEGYLMTTSSARPMTLGNMRQNGVRSLAITCGALHCHHYATINVSGFGDDVPVPAFGSRMVCTVCGAIGGSGVLGCIGIRRFRGLYWG